MEPLSGSNLHMSIILQESLRGLFYAPFYAALAHDAYAAEGVDVQIRQRPRTWTGRDRDHDFGSEADVSWGGPMRVMQTYHHDPACDLVCFGEVVTRDPFLLVGRDSRPAFSVRDLAGLRLASVSEVPTPWMCLQEDLRRAGVAPGTVNGADSPTERWPRIACRVAGGRGGRPMQVFEAVRFDSGGRSRMPCVRVVLRAGEPGTDELYDILLHGAVC